MEKDKVGPQERASPSAVVRVNGGALVRPSHANGFGQRRDYAESREELAQDAAAAAATLICMLRFYSADNRSSVVKPAQHINSQPVYFIFPTLSVSKQSIVFFTLGLQFSIPPFSAIDLV